MIDDDKMWTPSAAADHADDNPKVIANHIHALQRETRAGFESIAQALKAFERIDAKLDVIIDRQNVADARINDHERRLTALESKPKRRALKRK